MIAKQEHVMEQIKNNLAEIYRNIEEAANKSHRETADIKLVGVTKNREQRLVDAAIRAGLDIIGENKVQEAETKIPSLKEKYLEFHFVGHLQKNKINKLMPLNPSLIHSIDSLKTAEKLNRYCQDSDDKRKIEILVQVNCSEEESKYGLPNSYDLIKEFIQKLNPLSNIHLKGLMTIAPLTNKEAKIRASFAALRNYLSCINDQNIYRQKIAVLSMGMSNDYRTAIEEGANLVRIGSDIFKNLQH